MFLTLKYKCKKKIANIVFNIHAVDPTATFTNIFLKLCRFITVRSISLKFR